MDKCFRLEYIRSALLRQRLKTFQLGGLLNEDLEEFRQEHGIFLVSDSLFWYQHIPSVQWAPLPTQMALREALGKLLDKGWFAALPGWDNPLVRQSLLLWRNSPPLEGKGGRGCVYCQKDWGCMVCGARTPKMRCHLESGGHFCSLHGSLLLEEHENMFTYAERLKDGRLYTNLAKLQWADEKGFKLWDAPPARFVVPEEFGGWDFTPWCPRPLFRSTDHLDTDLLRIRDHMIQERSIEHPQTFWPPG